MDNVTHTLVGVVLARAFFQRVTPHATLLLVLSANLPDIDILSLAAGQLAYFEIHRGYTHTFLALPLLALLCVSLTALIKTGKLPFIKACLAASTGLDSHLLLDWTNSYGIRPLLPFSSRWFYLDLNGLYDGVFLVALVLALICPWFVSLVSSEIGRSNTGKGRGSAIAVLLFLMLFEAARWTLHQRALNELSSRLYDGDVPVQVAALPSNNPLRWTGVVETQDAFRLVPTSSLNLTNAADARIFFKPAQDITYQAVLSAEAFRYMNYFARFPVWRFEPLGKGKMIDLTDLRFGVPGGGSFHALAATDQKGQLLSSSFSFAGPAH